MAVSVVVTTVVSIGAPAPGAAPAQAAAPEVHLPRVGHSDRRVGQLPAGAGGVGPRACAVGQTATVRVTVRSQAAWPSTKVSFDLPSGVDFVSAGNAALSSERARDGQGAVRRAVVSTNLATGSARSYSYEIRPVKTGAVHLYLTASADRAGDVIDATETNLWFTVGATGPSSHLGAAPAPTRSTTTPVRAGARMATTPWSPGGRRILADPVGAPHQDEPSAGAGGQGCVTGGWFYVDNTGATRPAINESVEVWDHDSLSADDLLVVGVVGFDGRYRLCFSSNDGVGDSTQEVYVKYLTQNTRWRVRNTAASNQTYVFTTETVDVCDTCDHEYGNRQPTDTALMPGLHAFDEIGDLWRFVAGGSQNCFDRSDTTCRVMLVNWTSTSTDGTDYLNDSNQIRLLANADLAVHGRARGSHVLMDDVYEDDMPPSNCPAHDIPVAANAICAWVEGFAEWLPAQVYNNPIYLYPSGRIENLETPSWTTGSYDDGDTVEGRIAGTLIDISDSTNERFWDFASGGFVPVHDLHQHRFRHPQRVPDHRPGQPGLRVQRRPLEGEHVPEHDRLRLPRSPVSRDSKNRPNPVPPHNFVFTTSRSFWSVVGIDPLNDFDIGVYDNRNLTGPLGSSTFGGDTIDFVAVDSNRRPWATTTRRSCRSRAPVATTTSPTSKATSRSRTASGRAASARGTWSTSRTPFAAGVPTFFRIVPRNLDIEVFLMRSDSANAGTFVQGRSAAALVADVGLRGA